MGAVCLCESSNSEVRILREYNNNLKTVITEQLKKIPPTHWQSKMLHHLATSQDSSYLFAFGYNQDIDRMIAKAKNNPPAFSEIRQQQEYQEQVANSCLVPEDEVNLLQNHDIGDVISSFVSRADMNPSIVLQFDTIYKPFIQEAKYKQSTRLFLFWLQIAQSHFQSGFLVPLYVRMAKELKSIINNPNIIQAETLTKRLGRQVETFCRLMYSIYKEVYKFDMVEHTDRGKLFKEDNINHFVTNTLFKKSNLLTLLKKQLMAKQADYVQTFSVKLALIQLKSFDQFNIPPMFQLLEPNKPASKVPKTIAQSHIYEGAVTILKGITAAQTPISKLKILLQAQKEIIRQIFSFYSKKDCQPPQVDPDLIASLTMYMVAKSQLNELPIQLMIVQSFASKNALTTISGYYISTFGIAVSMINSIE